MQFQSICHRICRRRWWRRPSHSEICSNRVGSSKSQQREIIWLSPEKECWRTVDFYQILQGYFWRIIRKLIGIFYYFIKSYKFKCILAQLEKNGLVCPSMDDSTLNMSLSKDEYMRGLFGPCPEADMLQKLVATESMSMVRIQELPELIDRVKHFMINGILDFYLTSHTTTNLNFSFLFLDSQSDFLQSSMRFSKFDWRNTAARCVEVCSTSCRACSGKLGGQERGLVPGPREREG